MSDQTNVPTRREARRKAIEDAAYRVLIRDGYKAASLLAIAKEAKASNETLYKWYGNKQGLFASLVASNAERARDMLQADLESGQSALSVLENLGPVLLGVVTSERAVALNRAACGDVYDTGLLGDALAKGGRDSLLPLISTLLSQANEEGELAIHQPEVAAEIYISLLIGDVQIRRAIGVLEPPSEDEIARRSVQAMECLRRLYAAPTENR